MWEGRQPGPLHQATGDDGAVVARISSSLQQQLLGSPPPPVVTGLPPPAVGYLFQCVFFWPLLPPYHRR